MRYVLHVSNIALVMYVINYLEQLNFNIVFDQIRSLSSASTFQIIGGNHHRYFGSVESFIQSYL